MEIIVNIIFWVLSSWLIVSIFSIEALEVEIIDDKEVEFIKRSDFLITFFLIGQFLFAAYFYLHLNAIQKLVGQLDIRRFLIKSIALALLFLGVYYGISKFFIFQRPVSFPSISYGIFAFYAAVSTGYGFIKIWIKNERDKKQLELVKNKAELSLLRSQLHPHFLFNTMNNLLSMVDQKENPVLAKSIDKLSNLLRYVVYEAKNDKVAVADEIKFIKNFAELHLLRFEEGEVDFKLQIEGNYDQQLIETGILLCYIENAFKHGVQPEFQSFIHIKIDISKPNIIIFKIENSIPPLIGIKQEGGYGLKSNEERLQLAYPLKYDIKIEENKTYFIQLKIDTNEGNNS